MMEKKPSSAPYPLPLAEQDKAAEFEEAKRKAVETEQDETSDDDPLKVHSNDG